MRKLVLLSIFFPACISVEAPPLIDRHTIMESEAAGEFPELEKRFQAKLIKPGPVPIPKEANNKRKERVYSFLNGDLYTPVK